jgi:hypothetical protein
MSSLIYLAFSIIVFIISFGIMFYLLPMILGVLFSLDTPIMDTAWLETNQQMQIQLQWLIPLTMSLGLFVFALRVMMSASSRGRD